MTLLAIAEQGDGGGDHNENEGELGQRVDGGQCAEQPGEHGQGEGNDRPEHTAGGNGSQLLAFSPDEPGGNEGHQHAVRVGIGAPPDLEHGAQRRPVGVGNDGKHQGQCLQGRWPLRTRRGRGHQQLRGVCRQVRVDPAQVGIPAVTGDDSGTALAADFPGLLGLSQQGVDLAGEGFGRGCGEQFFSRRGVDRTGTLGRGNHRLRHGHRFEDLLPDAAGDAQGGDHKRGMLQVGADIGTVPLTATCSPCRASTSGPGLRPTT